MSERVPPSRGTRAGRRGRHKHAGSPEARRDYLAPSKPPWTTADVYRWLAELRERL